MRAPSLRASSTYSSTFRRCLSPPSVRPRSRGRGVADRDAGDGVGEDAQQGAVHRACHQQPRAAHAELPGVEDESLDDRADRLLQVGVLEDDVGRVAAQFHGDRLERLARDARGVPPDGGRTGEGELVDAGVAQQRLAGDRSAAGDDVHHTVRDPGLLEQAGHVQGAERGLVGGLVHHGVAGRESGASFELERISGKLKGVIAATTPSGPGACRRRRPAGCRGWRRPGSGRARRSTRTRRPP